MDINPTPKEQLFPNEGTWQVRKRKNQTCQNDKKPSRRGSKLVERICRSRCSGVIEEVRTAYNCSKKSYVEKDFPHF